MIDVHIADQNDLAGVYYLLNAKDNLLNKKLEVAEIDNLFNTISTLFIPASDQKKLVILYDDNKPKCMMSMSVLPKEYNAWHISNFRHDGSLWNKQYMDYCNICKDYLIDIAEKMGFDKYYSIIKLPPYMRTKTIAHYNPSFQERYNTKLFETIGKNTYSDHKFIRQYMMANLYDINLYVYEYRKNMLFNCEVTYNKHIKSVTINNFITNQDLHILNVEANRLNYFTYKNEIWHHKIARLPFARHPVVNKLAKNIYDTVSKLNDKYWQFELDTAFHNASGKEIMVEGNPNLIEPHFLVNQFGPGDSMDYHLDYHPTGRQANRKIAVVLQIIDQNHYLGGELILQAGNKEFTASKEVGSISFYPTFIPHRVNYVDSGIRRSIIYFITGANNFE